MNVLRTLFGSELSIPPLTRLKSAIDVSDTTTLCELIQAHPDLLNHQDEQGATPLHWAAQKQDLSVVAALVDLGADTTLKDMLGYTASHLGQYHGEFRMGCYTEVSKKIVERIETGVSNANH